MARKPSVGKKIEKISKTSTKELSELQEMLEKPDSVDDDSLKAVSEALLDMNTKWRAGFSECLKALQAKTKREPGETDRKIGMGSGAMEPYEEDALSIDEVLKS